MSGPPPTAPPPKRNLTPIIVAIVAFVVVVVVAVVVILLLPSGNNKNETNASATSSTTVTTSRVTTTVPTTTRTTLTTATSGNASNNAKLMAMLPKGYDSGVCKPIEPVSDALATIDCDKNSLTGGPEVARYVLYPSTQILAEKFQKSIDQDTLQACPGSSKMSPTKWYTDDPNNPLGQIACGIYKDKPDLVWTYDEKLFYADAQSSDMNSLFEWWNKNA